MIEVDAANRVQIDITIDYATTDAFVYEWLTDRGINFNRQIKTSGSALYQISWDEEIYGPNSTDVFTVLKRLQNTRFVFYHPMIENWEADLIVNVCWEFGAQFTDPDNPIVKEIQGRRGRPKERTFEEEIDLARAYILTQDTVTQQAFCQEKGIGVSTLKNILDNPLVMGKVKKRFGLIYAKKKRQG